MGQQNTSPAWISKCAHESAAHRIGDTWVHGMAFGSPGVSKKNKNNA